jgi:hypothetical protein
MPQYLEPEVSEPKGLYLKGVYTMRITTLCPECGIPHTFTVRPGDFHLGIGYLCTKCSLSLDSMADDYERSEGFQKVSQMVAVGARSAGPRIS